MKIGQYKLRKPWVKYVDLDIDKELYDAVCKSVGSSIVAEIISQDLCDYDCEVISHLEKALR